MTVTLTVWTNRSRNVNAFAATVVNGAANLQAANYGKPVDDDAQQRAYRGKAHQVNITLDDGTYQVKSGDSQGARSYTTFFVVNGDDYEEYDRLSDLPAGVDLPELEGSERQVSWANDLRAKALARIPGWENNAEIVRHLQSGRLSSAKVWIEKHEQIFNALNALY